MRGLPCNRMLVEKYWHPIMVEQKPMLYEQANEQKPMMILEQADEQKPMVLLEQADEQKPTALLEQADEQKPMALLEQADEQKPMALLEQAVEPERFDPGWMNFLSNSKKKDLQKTLSKSQSY